MPSDQPAAAVFDLDITREICPMTYVHVRLALDRLAPGEVLRVRLQGAEPARQVPATAAAQGHLVLDQLPQADGTVMVRIAKGAPGGRRPPQRLGLD